MKLSLVLMAILFVQETVPYKPSGEFQVNIDLKYKEKPSGFNNNTYTSSGERLDKTKAGLQPFLSVSVTQLKIQEDEAKIMAVDSNGKMLTKKKATPTLELQFEMGFVEDLKGGAVSNTITLFFLSSEKKQLRKIVFGVSSKGIFEVNGQWHGQF